MPRSLPATLALLVLLATLPGAPAEAVQENRVANGGFEADADGDGMPDGWRVRQGSSASVRLSTLLPYEGARSLELTPARPSEVVHVVSDPVPVSPGEHLRLTLQGRFLPFPHWGLLDLDPYSQPSVAVEFLDALGRPLTRFETAFPNGRTWWGDGVESVVPPDAVQAAILLRVRGPGVFHADDVRLVPYHDPNPVPNPSFETGLNGPNGWGTCADQWEEGGSDGRRSVFLDAWGSCEGGVGSHPFVLAPGAYELSVDRILRGTTLDPVVVAVRVRDAEGATLARHVWEMKGHDGGWRTVRLPFCAPPGTSEASLGLGGSDHFSGPVSWDHVRLVRTGGCEG